MGGAILKLSLDTVGPAPAGGFGFMCSFTGESRVLFVIQAPSTNRSHHANQRDTSYCPETAGDP